MTKFLKNADVTGYISQTSVTSSLVKTDVDGKLVAAIAGTDYNAPGVSASAGTLIREIRNTTGATLTKGTIVYISGATGNKPTVSKALATGDSTSAQTFGMCQTDIPNNSNGNVVCFGDLSGLNTSAFTEGAQLYLSSTTAGEYTTTKQLAPAHLVYIGVVTRSHPTQGQIEVKIQNGYELDEIHDVAISSLANNQGLFYESATDLWKNKTIATVLGYTPADDAAVVKLTGNQTVGGVKTFTASLLANNPSEGATGEGLIAGQSFKIDGTGTGQRAIMYVVSRTLSDTYASGLTAQYSNFAGDKAFGFNLNTAGGFELYVKNTSFGKALAIANTMAATFGDSVTATSFIKTSGTSAQFLKADGSVDSSTYLTSYTESDTLATVTGRGNTTTTRIGVSTSTAINLAGAGNSGTWIGGVQDATTGWSISTNGIGLKADDTTYATIGIAASNGIMYFGRTTAAGVGTLTSWLEVNSAGVANFIRARPQHNGNNLALVSEIPTNLDQLTNGPGYITSAALSSYLPLAGGTMTGIISFSNVTGNKIDLYHSTTGSGDRYGMQVQSSELRIHSGAAGADSGGITFGKSTTTTFTETMRVRNDGIVNIAGYLRTAGVTSNSVVWSGGADSADFGNVLGQGTSSRSTLFRGNGTTTSVWWGGTDGLGNVIPFTAIDATSGEFSFWRNSGGVGGGAWTKIMTMNASGLTINAGNFVGTLIGGITGNAASVTHNASRADSAYYNVGWFAGASSPAYSCDAVQIQSSTGTLRATTFSGALSGNASSSTITTFVASPDGGRNPNTFALPTSNPRSVKYDFSGIGNITGATGNYAGVMTYSPWDGTSASTGDSSYQLAFCNWSGVNASGLPGLAIRNGINSSWNATWYQVLHSGNFSSYAVPLTGGTISGTLIVQGGGNNGPDIGLVARDISASRSATTGVIYLGSNGGHYVYYNGTDYVMPGGNLYVNGTQVVLNSGSWGISVTGSSSTVTHLSGRTDSASYNVVWAAGSPSHMYSCDAVRIQSSTGTLFATTFSGALSGTASGNALLGGSTANQFDVLQLGFPATAFNPSAAPRTTMNSMSVKMWNNYFNGTGLGSDYGTVMQYYSLSGHVDSQVYFDASGGSWYRSASYAAGWQGWQRYITDANYTNWAVPKTGGTFTGALTIDGNITMGSGGASSILMRDSDEGTREIHCNSERIGFLTQSGNWGAYCEDGGSFVSIGDIKGNDVYTTGGWFRNHTSNNGIYWSNTAWHLYPENSSDFYMRSGASDCSLHMVRNGTSGNYVHCSAASEIGFLSTARNWIFRVDNAGNCYAAATVNATAFYETSDATIKTLITDNYQAKGIESVVAKLYIKNGKEELGYYAQDVQDILPSAISKGEDGLLSLSYREVHTAKIARLEKEVEELKSQLARL
jgi:hypothetical protein